MKAKTTVMALTICSAFLAALTAQALPDRDMHLNGHFRGAAQGHKPAPGWTLTADGGSARILPALKPGKFMLELKAAPNRSQSVVSDLKQVFGNVIEIKGDISGRGNASFGYEAFDQSGRQLIARENQNCILSRTEQEFKRYFKVSGRAKYIRVKLTAERGSVAVFRDVDAEMKMAAPPPAPAAAVPPPPPRPVPAPAAVMLQHHHFYKWASLRPVEHFKIQLPVGSEIEFKLQEDRHKNLYWSVVSYDNRICRVKVDHDRDGVYPFRTDKADFELKALWRGTTNIVLTCGKKKVIIQFTAI